MASDYSNTLMKKKILFVTYGGGHAHMVCPVVLALRQSPAFLEGALEIQVLGLPAAKHTLAASNIDCLRFNDYLDPVADADAIAWGTELAKTHHSPTIGVPLEDSIAYLGLNYKDLVVRLGKEEAQKRFAAKNRQIFYPLTIMERVFDDVRPDFVVTSNSPRSEAAAIEVANKRGIASLIMTDLFTGLGGYVLKARHVTFLNEFAKNMFAADGLLDEGFSQFHYTGNPAFDKILQLAGAKDEAWIAKHFPQAKGKKLVLHADMPAYWDPVNKCSYFKTDADIVEEMNACYDATLQNGAYYLIRPHPSQDRTLYHHWLNGKPDAQLAAECNLHELLKNMDLLVARTTTVGLEASYLQKRILQLDYEFHTDLPLAKMGVAWGVNAYSELADEMRSALGDDVKFEEIKRKAKQVLPNEPAAAKIASIIIENMSKQ